MRPHLYFKNPQEGLEEYVPRPGGGGTNKDENKDANYIPMADRFEQCQNAFFANRNIRHSKRTLDVPSHFDLIEIEFHGCYYQPGYEQSYINDFGLSLVRLFKFNHCGLFIIEDQERFNAFINNLSTFISNVRDDTTNEYDSKIKFIRSFKLYDSGEMIRDIDNFNVLHLSLLHHSLLQEQLIIPQKEALDNYFKENGIDFNVTENSIEIFNTSEEILAEILDNFDVIYATCSGSGSIIRPDAFNLPERHYGFTINTENINDLPIIGVIDSGVSNQTPLTPLIINPGDEYDLTNTGLFFDHTDHGTGVAAFAALGNSLIPDNVGELEADARILPIKILNNNSAPISQSRIVNLIRKANADYGVKIFTLTIGYGLFPIADNDEFSSYAIALDKLTNELDILIFISTTNNCHNIDDSTAYPQKFADYDANIAPPADSLNNITVGAVADNFEQGDFIRRSGLPDFPSIYSRKSHLNFLDDTLFNASNRNKHLLKPDIIMPGGDYEQYFVLGGGFEDRGNAALTVLSSNLNDRTVKRIGTSYSAPLAANLAARLLKLYPDLDMQTVKALILNSSNRPVLGDNFNGFHETFRNRIIGQGIPKQQELLYSDNNQATLILEDTIVPGFIQSYALHIPEYLNESSKDRTLLTITSTLSFKFKPKTDNQLLYNPIHIGYAICKNLPLDTDGTCINGSGSKDIKLNSSCQWSQDYYYRTKIVSNVQKMSFNVSRTNIVDEENTFKVAINSAFHKLLTEADQEEYNHEIPFSLVINIKQNPKTGEILNDLYDELEAINTLEAVNDIGDIEVEL
ncbi:MAG: S8 family serine peptidase [Draconibacterium sp.]|jgi:hypothetical protein|tara:strand:+ start:37585 stop:39990 length:2406 start_codon:yes stop_codon:yes gene_type:complete